MCWKPYDEMSRLEQKMYWAVREETMLHELPLGEIDRLGPDREVVWPEENPRDCSQALLGWFDAGLVTVMHTESQEELPASEAHALLGDPQRWSPAHSLVLTDAGGIDLTFTMARPVGGR